jgi:hypothetical protein
MRRIFCGFLIVSALAWADERTDRHAIEGIIESLNTDGSAEGQKRVASLFTDDADNQLAKLSDLNRGLVPSDGPWSEVTKPHIRVQAIRFITDDVALVDAVNAQYGSTMLVRRVPLLLVLKRQGKEWRIASLRVLVDVVHLP